MTIQVAEIWRYGLLIGQESLLRVYRAVLSLNIPHLPLPSAAPVRLLVAPTDLRSADPLEAEDLLNGRFALAGQLLEAGDRAPFSCEMPDDAFLRALARFSWLRHLRTQQSAQTGDFAQKAVISFLRRHRGVSGRAWDNDVISDRLIAWLSHSTVILKGAEATFYRRFANATAQQERVLRKRYRAMPHDETRLLAAIALCMAAICLDMPEKKRHAAADRLDAALEQQMLTDGGHIARNPQTLLNLLFQLLPLRQTYINLNLPLPKRLVSAIDRIYPALRFFRHADGNLALFNGAGPVLATEFSSLLRYDETGETQFKALPHSGFHRLQADGTIVIVETGKPRNTHLSKTAHAGTFSFEMSSSRNRFIVNAGAPRVARTEFSRLARSTAAHSTVNLSDTSSMRFSRSEFLGPVEISGIRHVQTERSEDEAGADRLQLKHDGYLSRFGVYCTRSIALSVDGQRITGIDSFRTRRDSFPASDNKATAIARFHVHPSIWIMRDSDHSIFLTAPDNESWLFSAPGHRVEIEEDLFFAANSGMTHSSQITISFVIGEQPELKWQFERQG